MCIRDSISNTNGFASVGSMVVYEKGKPKRNDYRKFKIKGVQGADDYASMEEVLTRRFEHGLKERQDGKELGSFHVFPDLIMMDRVSLEDSKILQSINPRNTFESFVVGESNKFAHAAALAVAQNVGNAFNPLFLYGDTGLGKTHLMHAIAHFIIKNNPSAKVMYISSEAFVNDYINALGNGNITAFRKRYRNTDVLLIDDIQFFAKKESSQNEFFHTFNELFNANKQIVLSCDKPINEVEDIEKRLVSRFAWGMSVPIEMPRSEERRVGKEC